MARPKPDATPEYKHRELTDDEQKSVKAALRTGKDADMAALHNAIPGLAIAFDDPDNPGYIVDEDTWKENNARHETHQAAVTAQIAQRGSLRRRIMEAQPPLHPEGS